MDKGRGKEGVGKNGKGRGKDDDNYIELSNGKGRGKDYDNGKNKGIEAKGGKDGVGKGMDAGMGKGMDESTDFGEIDLDTDVERWRYIISGEWERPRDAEGSGTDDTGGCGCGS